MEHPEDYKLRKRYEADRASGIAQGVSTAEGKTFSFSRGEKQNRYITNDAEEIKILRDYIKTRVDNMFTEVRE